MSRRAGVPYVSQFASPELAGEIVAGRMRIGDDPRWRESGATSADEYARWAGAGCGMACLQMLLGALGRPAPGLVELGRGCERYGGYRTRADGGLDGLYYAGFAAFAAAEFGLDARVAAPLGLPELVQAVAGDEVVLASVNKTIRTPHVRPPARGGHLVLVIDADPALGRLRFHNPSGHHASTQRHVSLELERFEPFYAGRGIAVRLPDDEDGARTLRREADAIPHRSCLPASSSSAARRPPSQRTRTPSSPRCAATTRIPSSSRAPTGSSSSSTGPTSR